MAYGVTTEKTALASNRLGFPSAIITPKLDPLLDTQNVVFCIGHRFAKLILSNKFKFFVSLRLFLFSFYYSFILVIKFNRKAKMYWTRDIFLALLLTTFSSKKVVCEIHRVPKKNQLVLFKLLKLQKNLVLAPITDYIRTNLDYSKDSIVTLPMSVDQSEIEFYKRTDRARLNRVIHVGNFSSGGNLLQVNLINEAAKIIKEVLPNWKIEIIGVSKYDFISHISDQVSSNLEIIGKLSRNEVVARLDLAKIGLVTYPDTDYFHDSFPIKIVEYSAAGLAIVASDTFSHRQALAMDRCVYFQPNSFKDLASKIILLATDDSLRLRIAKNSTSWASLLSYENRVSNAIKIAKLNF